MRLFFRILSSFFYRSHHFVEQRFLKKKPPDPYRLNYTTHPDKKKIIHLNGNFFIGGTNQLIVDIIERTSDEFYHKLVVPFFPDPLPYQQIDIVQFSVNEMDHLYDFLEIEKPALVHLHYWVRYAERFKGTSVWYQNAFKICEELKIPIVQNIDVPTEPFRNPVVIHNVFVSKYVLNNFNTAPAVRSSVIYPGSDFNHFKNERSEDLPADSIGMVYRLDTDKLNEEAIEVFIEVVKMKPTVKCYIIGGGHYFDYYQKRVKAEELSANFIFTGYVSYKHLPDYYRKFGIFVTPVHDESFGQVSPFAMSMGLTIAGYDTGALSEILGSKENLVPYGNVALLSKRILALLEDRKTCIQTGKINQERATRLFSVETMIQSYRDLYTSCLGEAWSGKP